MEKQTEKIVEKLNILLADFQMYYQNLRGFHWNIKGKHFFELHEKYEQLYLEAAQRIDDVAERILTLGGRPLHSFESYINTADIKAMKDVSEGEATVKGVVSNLKNLLTLENEILELASKSGDTGTEDLMTGLIEAQEKTVWMFKAWLG